MHACMHESSVVRTNLTLFLFQQDFTFGMVTDDEEDGIMGKIVVPENSENIDDGDILCIVLHRKKAEETAVEED